MSTNDTKLQAVEKDLAKISNGMSRSAKLTMVVGIVLMALLLGYFIFGFNEIKDLTKPENLVALAGEVVDSSIPEILGSVEETVTNSAPDWAAAVSDQAIGAAPTVRESLEEYILDQTEGVIDQTAGIGEKQFRQILRDNRTSFEETIDQLADDQDYSDETLKIFMDAVNKELGQDMQSQAQDVLGTLIALNEKLQKLSNNESLNKEEALERQTLMVIRRLQLQEADAQFEARKKAEEEAAVAARAEAAATDGAEDGEGESEDAPEESSDEDSSNDAPAEASSDEEKSE